MKTTLSVAVLFVGGIILSCTAYSQTNGSKDEIPPERCDWLPVVTAKVAGVNRRFLLDTGATTILDLKLVHNR
jgi:hypothetical protein